MEGQLSLEDRAHARRTDPDTSHQAAASISVDDLRESQRRVWRVIHNWGPLTDTDLCRLYRETVPAPKQSDSGLRTRRRELVDAGLVFDSQRQQQLASGRWSIMWEVE